MRMTLLIITDVLDKKSLLPAEVKVALRILRESTLVIYGTYFYCFDRGFSLNFK